MGILDHKQFTRNREPVPPKPAYWLFVEGKPVQVCFGEEKTDVKETVRNILTKAFEEKIQQEVLPKESYDP